MAYAAGSSAFVFQIPSQPDDQGRQVSRDDGPDDVQVDVYVAVRQPVPGAAYLVQGISGWRRRKSSEIVLDASPSISIAWTVAIASIPFPKNGKLKCQFPL